MRRPLLPGGRFETSSSLSAGLSCAANLINEGNAPVERHSLYFVNIVRRSCGSVQQAARYDRRVRGRRLRGQPCRRAMKKAAAISDPSGATPAPHAPQAALPAADVPGWPRGGRRRSMSDGDSPAVGAVGLPGAGMAGVAPATGGTALGGPGNAGVGESQTSPMPLPFASA